MMSAIRAAFGLVVIVFLAGPAAAQPREPLAKNCHTPAVVSEAAVALPHTARMLKREGAVRIVALGSSSTMGSGGSGEAASWPAQLQQSLAKRLPQAKVTVINKGQMRQSVPQMLERLAADVLAQKPSLVIWEAGTSEAVRGAEVDTLIGDLLEGIDRVATAKMDIMLMDMQYARNTARIINFQPYVDAMERAATMRSIYLFPRYDIMREWVENEQVTFEGQSKGEAMKTADQVYACIGRFLAEIVANSLQPR
jgi:lysophospholipase L1-like esterase